MKKRLLSILLSVYMVLTLLPTVAFAVDDYGIWVGTAKVTSDNANNVTGPGITGTVTYDATTNTLTLNNANITSATESHSDTDYFTGGIIKFSGDLNIVLHGANTIAFNADSELWVAGIYTGGNLNITGTAADSLSVVNTFSTQAGAMGIKGNTGVTIDGCTVTATAGTSTSDTNTTGIYVVDGNLSIKNAVVTANGGSTQRGSFAIVVDRGSLSIDHSTVTANGVNSTSGGFGYGITTSNGGTNVTISASTVTAKGSTRALNFVHYDSSPLTDLTAVASTNINGDGAAAVTVNTSVYGTANTYKYVQITPAPGVSIGTLAVSGSFTAGQSITLSDLTSYKPTITTNGVTITEEGWQLYNPNGGGYWQTLMSGSITPDTGSTYKLRYYATYSGGTVYSNEVTLTVVGNTTALVLTASPASLQSAGTQVTLTATLTGFFTGPGVNGQTITFKNGSTTLGTASLNSSGIASYTWTPSDTGTYSLIAAYAATAYNKAATSEAVAYTVGAPSLPTALTYATDAASGTDYVLDTTNKILTIKTAKGAAFWSASGTSYLNYTILLESNVDVSGFSWTPVGNASSHFTGTFDGQGHSITRLTASAASFAGLFSHAKGATIKNLCLSGSVQISGSPDGNYGGALVAYAVNCTIVNCCSHTDVTATSSGTADTACAGGLLGIADSATAIINCFNTGSIRATGSGVDESNAYAGGIAGYNYDDDVSVINCYSIGSVAAAIASNCDAGGVVGYISGTVENCYYLNSAAGKGIGNVEESPAITGCGTFAANGALTAGTADQFRSAQTLAYTSALHESLNGWVNAKASTDYRVWQADSGHINGGYPVFGMVWDPTGMSGVGCDVAAGKLTGTTTNMQYSLDGGTTWQDCAAGNTSGLTFAAGTVKIRQKDNETNERTVITIAAPAASDAPTLDSKTYNSVKLTVMAGYEYSRDGGLNWQDSNLFSDLNSGTAYSFVTRIKATATTLPGTVSTALSVTTSSASSGSGSSSSETGAPVIVDGKTHNIGTEKKSGGATTVTVDQSKLSENMGGAASGSSVVVPVSENGSATASLVVKNIEDMAAKSMTLTVQSGSVAYNLNTSAIDTAALRAAFPRSDMSKVPFDVTIQNSSVSVEGETLVLSPVAFTVTATYSGKTVSVDTFSAYIDRVIKVTAEQAAKITTAVVINADGSVRHIPTNVIEKDGKYYAVINSRTNSTYALIQNEITFADAEGKWYEAAVDEMGSRKIIKGRSASVFDGEASITRAEFAAILVRALGLPADGTSSFSDVPTTAWYTGAVATAVQYGITVGRENGRFDPTAAITRQEAMLMLQRAAALTGFSGASGALDGFADAGSVGSWALDAAKWSVGSGLIQGADGKLNPTANITRAESATIILRLLQKAGLVDVRS